jgi:predicted permease
MSLPQATYKTPKDFLAFYLALDRQLNSIPGVRAAGIGSDLPWTGYNENIGGLTAEGRHPAPGQEFKARYHAASENYFAALGIPLIRGRYFTPHDDISGRPVIILNRIAAETFWPGADPIGRRITFDDNPKENDWFTVCGVIGDIKDRPNNPAAEPAIWWPLRQTPFGFIETALVIRGQSGTAQLGAEIRAAVASLDSSLAVANVTPMEQVAGKMFSTPRFALFLIALFAALAATLAAIGIYGVISYSVSRRTQEFGLRVAVGARPWDVVRQVMSQGLKLALAGVVLGTAGALALGRVLSSLLYQVSASDPATFAAVAVTAFAAAGFACYIPARRATAADPMSALRAE